MLYKTIVLNSESIRSTPKEVQVLAQRQGLGHISESSVIELVKAAMRAKVLPAGVLFFEDTNWWSGIIGGEDDRGKLAMIRKWIADEWRRNGSEVTTLDVTPLTERRGNSLGWHAVLEQPNQVVKITRGAFGATHSGFHHPFIVPEKILALEGNTVLSFSEWYDGAKTLDRISFVGSDALVSPKFRLARLAEAMQGCAHMHERGWAHLDFKPSNILVCEGAGMLFDLETMLPLECPVHNAKLRASAPFLDWFVLEQKRVEVIVDTQDVFAAGISILQTQHPSIRNLGQVRDAIRTNSNGKSDLATLIAEMVQEKPNQRPTMRDSATRLQAILAAC